MSSTSHQPPHPLGPKDPTSGKDPAVPVSDVVLWEEQHKDPEVSKLLQACADNCPSLTDQYEIIEDKLYHKTYLSNNQLHYRIYIPSSLRSTLLQHYHSTPMSGHGGIYKTYKRLQEVAFWPGMWSAVKQHVRTCVKCQTLKSDNRKPAGKLQQITTSRPNQMLGVDIMGPLPRSTNQNEYLLVFVDYYSRWVELFPIRSATAKNVASIFRKDIHGGVYQTSFSQIEVLRLFHLFSESYVRTGVLLPN